MTECPCCLKLTLNADGRCTRCGVCVPRHKPEVDFVHHTSRPRSRTQEPWETDYSRTKEDKR